MLTITDSGSLSAASWHAWSDRIFSPGGGMIAAPLTNTDDLLVLILPAGNSATGFEVSEATPGVIAIKPGQWIVGTLLDSSNAVYIAPNSGTQGYAMMDIQGFCPGGLVADGSPSPLTALLVGNDGNSVQVNSDGSLAVITYEGGSVYTKPPANFSTTDWTTGSTPALPSNVKALQVNTAVGTGWTLIFDGGGNTGLEVIGQGPTLVQFASAANISRIASPANGSTSLSVGFVLH